MNKPNQGRRYKKSFNENKAKELLKKNVKVKDIAKMLDVHSTAIYNYRKEITEKKQELDKFRENRADYLTDINRDQVVAEKLVTKEFINTYNEEGKSPLSWNEKRAMLHTIQGGHGIIKQDERLERGQSTENISYSDITDSLAKLEERERKLKAEMGDVEVEIEGFDSPKDTTC
jgi:predicted transcriptional regulator